MYYIVPDTTWQQQHTPQQLTKEKDLTCYLYWPLGPYYYYYILYCTFLYLSFLEIYFFKKRVINYTPITKMGINCEED